MEQDTTVGAPLSLDPYMSAEKTDKASLFES